MLTKYEVKKRWWKKIYDEAEIIKCACGCDLDVKSKDHYGRDRSYINGHNGRKYSNSTQYKREYNHRNRKKRYKDKTDRALKYKIKLIIKSGSECMRCGLKLNLEINNSFVFDFHHIDPSIKKFNLNLSCFYNKSLALIYEEHAKCMLLCSNCHRFIHYEKK